MPFTEKFSPLLVEVTFGDSKFCQIFDLVGWKLSFLHNPKNIIFFFFYLFHFIYLFSYSFIVLIVLLLLDFQNNPLRFCLLPNRQQFIICPNSSPVPIFVLKLHFLPNPPLFFQHPNQLLQSRCFCQIVLNRLISKFAFHLPFPFFFLLFQKIEIRIKINTKIKNKTKQNISKY